MTSVKTLLLALFAFAAPYTTWADVIWSCQLTYEDSGDDGGVHQYVEAGKSELVDSWLDNGKTASAHYHILQEDDRGLKAIETSLPNGEEDLSYVARIVVIDKVHNAVGVSWVAAHEKTRRLTDGRIFYSMGAVEGGPCVH